MVVFHLDPLLLVKYQYFHLLNAYYVVSHQCYYVTNKQYIFMFLFLLYSRRGLNLEEL